MPENKNFFYSQIFLYLSCALVFLVSIFLRSSLDIGADTGIYLDLGEKVFLGKKYYYDFFESNFPLPFYFYAAQFFISKKTGINPIILSEIIINFLALFSIIFSAKILKNSNLYKNKAHFNLIIFSYFLGFFLRPVALQLGEFGTKTSLLLILFYPYLSYSFSRQIALDKKNLICKGALMGLMPCLKIHYLILIIPIEIYQFLQKPKKEFFLAPDKLVMALTGSLALFLMVKFTPQYFEFIPSMWPFIYQAYNDKNIFIENLWTRFSLVAQFIFIFLIFAKKQLDENDKILLLAFFSSVILICLENIGTIDQLAIFYALASIALIKFIFDLLNSQQKIISNNLFIVGALLLLPIFDLEVLPTALIGLGGFVNMWWIVIWHYFFKKIIHPLKFLSLYFVAILLAFCAFKFAGPFCYIAVNLTLFFLALFFIEKKNSSQNFSALSVFAIFLSLSILLYSYISSIVQTANKSSHLSFPNQLSDMIFYYNKKYAPQNEQYFLMNATLNSYKFPAINYLDKNNNSRFHIEGLQADFSKSGSTLMFDNKNPKQVFTLAYLFDDVKNALLDKNLKIIFFNNSAESLNKKDRCLISTLEFYFLDPVFRKNFLHNFRFENHVTIAREKRIVDSSGFFANKNSDIFTQLKPSSKPIFYDFEIYVRQ